MKHTLLFLSLLLVLLSCGRTFDPPGVDDILIDQYEGIKTIPDPFLAGITVTNSGSPALLLVPAFDREVTNYQTSVNNAQTTVQFICTTSHSNATIRLGAATLHSAELSAPLLLQTGTNTVNLDVYAQDGLTTRRYTVQVVRSATGGSTNNLLASLVLAPSNISGFVPAVTVYTVDVSYEVSSVTVTPTVADGTASLFVNGSPLASGGSRAVSVPVIGTNTISIVVQAQNGNQRQYTVRIIRAAAPPSPVTSLLITEWGDAGTGVDFIELRNFGSGTVTLTSETGLYYHNTLVLMERCGTGTDPTLFPAIGSGITIDPGEVVLVVEQDVTAANLSTMRTTWGNPLPLGCKIFISSETTLIGSGERLYGYQACLTNTATAISWSCTPDPLQFGLIVGSNTYAALKTGFNPTTDSTTNTLWWESGTATDSHFRTPGVWP